MSINHLLNAMRLQASAVQGQQTFTRVGILSTFDPNTYSGKVLIQPDNFETGYLPILSQWVGNQWGLFAPPTQNDIVLVSFIDGNIDAGVIIGCNFNNQFRPQAVNSGEFWLVHKSGSYLKFTNDGKVLINSDSDLNITVDGSVNITGPVNITGALGVSGAITSGDNITDYKDSMEDIRTIYNEHQHGPSPLPSPQMPT
jgi:phage baseplate assembly protein gpV